MELHNRSVRQDIRDLGALIGDVISSNASTDAFEAVETVRTTAITYRSGDHDTRVPLESALTANSAEVNADVARAFTTYFELINLAEERERIRTLRHGDQEGTLSDSLRAAVERLIDDGDH